MARPTALAIPRESATVLSSPQIELTLTKGTSGHLDTVRDTVFRVTRGDGTDLSELLQVVHLDVVARQMEHDVLQSATASSAILITTVRGKGDARMTVGKDESISVEPFGVFSGKVHVSSPEDMGCWCHSLSRVRMERAENMSGHTMGAPG